MILLSFSVPFSFSGGSKSWLQKKHHTFFYKKISYKASSHHLDYKTRLDSYYMYESMYVKKGKCIFGIVLKNMNKGLIIY